MSEFGNKKIKYLLLGLLFDLVGTLSFFIPGIGEFSDIIWAPLAGWLMIRMYRGIPGKTAGVLTFLEELLPGIDIIPTFTLMWIYTFVFKKGQGEMQVTSTEN
jgi:hypothetical protein